MITNQLRDEIGALNTSKGWYDNGKRSIAVHCNLLHTEVTEAFEDYRDNKAIDEVWYEYELSDGTIKRYNRKEMSAYTLGITDEYTEESSKTILGKPCGIPSELADVVIRALDMAYEYKVDMSLYEYPKHYFTELDDEPIEAIIAFMHGCISKIFFADEVDYPNLAAIISVCLYIANRYNINLEEQIRDKIEYNKTRPVRHGGKRL